ncbi:biotin transporter BioY [uncultured Metabacillus sp.]|uniref:biotin transporter BioY n=1 Tax=Metabacillus sp. Hm71 TaxID=3450743 RepID=UPI002616697A|nr:biotin transporter BioY [uncultured Metabacillus sp.]
MKVQEMTYIALFTAVMGALGLVPPIMLTFTPVPITLQTLGVLLSGGVLGARLGAFSQILFLLLVAAGMPLLSGGRGGIGVFFGPSAGYLLAYPLTAFIIGYLLTKFKAKSLQSILFINLTVGILLIYFIGIPVQAFIMEISLFQAIKLSLVYIPGDVLKAIIASYLVYQLRKSPIISRKLAKSSETL